MTDSRFVWWILRTIARLMIFPAVQSLWQFLFSVVGWVLRPQVRTLTPSGTDRVLVLAPHPDDETIGCGGTIALHTRYGDKVTVCIVTDGGQSRAGGLPPANMVRRRQQEAQAAVSRLGKVELIQMGLPEGKWADALLTTELTRLIRQVQPTIVYTTSPVDFHPDHIRVAQCLANVLEQCETCSDLVVRLYEVQVPLTLLLASTVADIGEVSVLKSAALSEYKTQSSLLLWLRRLAHYQQRLYRASSPVEVFCDLSADQFVSIVRIASREQTNYRGIRPRPFTDPAAWLIGRRGRLILRTVISHSFDGASQRGPSYVPLRLPLSRRIIRRPAKRLLSWRYRNFTPSSSPDTTVTVSGIRLRVLRGVFNPSMHFTSGLLVDHLTRAGTVRPGWSVLDLGTGTGVVAIAAALVGAGRVVAIDINPTAVRCAALNVRQHGLGQSVSVRQGDMFESVAGEHFDLVMCNPPYFRGEPTSMAERAYLAGPVLEWLTRFGVGLADHLNRDGSAIISIGDAADIPAILAILTDCGWSCTVVARRDILVESIYLFKLTRAPEDQSHAG